MQFSIQIPVLKFNVGPCISYSKLYFVTYIFSDSILLYLCGKLYLFVDLKKVTVEFHYK